MVTDEPRRDRTDLISAALLGLATLASAWCAYQSGLWGGEQTRNLARTSALHFEALRQISEAETLQLVDVSTFLSYVEKDAGGDRTLAEYFRQHARPEFRAALESWIAERESGHEPRALPFKSPRYRLEPASLAAQLNEQANAANTAANEANGHGDLFVLHTVMFAMALFFLGTSSAAQRRTFQRTMLLLGTLVLVLATISMARLPRAPSAPHRSDLQKAQAKGRSLP